MEPERGLFANSSQSSGKRPLADRMRPATLDEVVGQEEVVGAETILRKLIAAGEIPSLILWGPPGSGKTTIAMLVAKEAGLSFVSFSAVTAGVKEAKEIIAASSRNRSIGAKPTALFIDEIHHFNRSQQDAFLPHVENGTIVLIGATTENPSFEVNSALLSRCRVFILRRLADEELRAIVGRAIEDGERGLGKLKPILQEGVMELICAYANGDARSALNILEMVVLSAKPSKEGSRAIDAEMVASAAQRRSLYYDKDREEHYNIISALHKSLRGGDPSAALYWLARMLEAGEDPLYVARRMVRFASEDIGNADPQALIVAIAAKDAADFLGMPECNTALAQAAVYLATAPKSNAVYTAYGAVKEDIDKTQNLPVPLHLRNAPTKLMKSAGYGKGYQYSHDFPGAIDSQEYLPDRLKGKRYYHPKDAGFEAEIKRRLEERERRRNAGE